MLLRASAGVVLGCLLALTGVLFGCDQGKQANQKVRGPLVSLVEANVGVNRPLAANGVIRLRFDRYLLPSTVYRQPVQLINETTNQPLPAPVVTYDPVALTVTLRNPVDDPERKWLEPGRYKVAMRVAGSDGNPEGLRAIDGAPLREAFTVSFQVDSTILPRSAVLEPTMEFCADVLPVLQAKCGTGSPCHNAPTAGSQPASSLVLTTSDGFRQTACSPSTRTCAPRLAQGANTGGSSTSTDTGRVFGIDMPLVAPGDPGNSWLLYKVLLAPLPTTPLTDRDKGFPLICSRRGLPDAGVVASADAGAAPADGGAGVTRTSKPTGIAPTPADDAEHAILSDHVLGREMPYPPLTATGYETRPLDFDDRERLRIWIAQGAVLQDCETVCQ